MAAKRKQLISCQSDYVTEFNTVSCQKNKKHKVPWTSDKSDFVVGHHTSGDFCKLWVEFLFDSVPAENLFLFGLFPSELQQVWSFEHIALFSTSGGTKILFFGISSQGIEIVKYESQRTIIFFKKSQAKGSLTHSWTTASLNISLTERANSSANHFWNCFPTRPRIRNLNWKPYCLLIHSRQCTTLIKWH